ncbi:spoIIIJ-associated protein [Desemzia incerta]|uniref:RNA-binding protein KhpB n=1 Tax=Desemzia incerta TaxID=82801 RepID=A0A1I5XE50_9LACT|nr:RNA-binding cell elongation regulator Jag/EloR [Desemzia incerta]SFQ30230.1 spoIIIJ-associated protein [Desemzia incerta]
MDKYTAKAPTVGEAIEKALRTLGVKREEASIEVIEEGKKGFLGFGQKDAVVKVTKHVSAEATPVPEAPIKHEQAEEVEQAKPEISHSIEEDQTVEEEAEEAGTRNDEEAIDLVAAYLTNIAETLGAPASIKVEQQDKQVVFNLDAEKAGVLIGKHGKVLNALQSLAQVLLHRHAKSKMVAIVNIGDYRERREAILKRLAERTAAKVKETNQPVFLEPMPAFERKVIHFYLSQDTWVTTHSEGREPHRYLVVEPSEKQI